MTLTQQIAKQIRDAYFGGNWTSSHVKAHVSEVNWKQATHKVHSFNTIAILFFHMNYYVRLVTQVLKGGPLDGKDKLSFAHPPIESQEVWEAMQEQAWIDVEAFAKAIEAFPEEKLWGEFFDEKYGNYYRNLCGIVEHVHYHLGQIVLIKKIIQEEKA